MEAGTLAARCPSLRSANSLNLNSTAFAIHGLRSFLAQWPLERFPKGVTRLSGKKRDPAKNPEPFAIQLNREGL
jgi:hypothetical protein